MTRTTNARIAGITFLLYIVAAFPCMVLIGRATRGEGMSAKLAQIAAHTSDLRLVVALSLVSCFAALVLGVTLYRITCDADRDVAMLALICRVGEGVLGGTSILATLGLLWLATASGANAPDTASAQTLGAFLLKVQSWNMLVSATFFAVGSTLFSYLLLRGRIVPVALAWLGVIASVIVVIGLPLQLVEVQAGALYGLMWFPMLAFEVVLALWLIVKGVAIPREI